MARYEHSRDASGQGIVRQKKIVQVREKSGNVKLCNGKLKFRRRKSGKLK